jgi:hypothetical protein
VVRIEEMAPSSGAGRIMLSMPDLSPSEALTTCERALRQLFAHAYAVKHGSEWLAKIASEADIADWREKHEVEHKRRTSRGVAQVPEDELAYADFYDLCTIAKRHWEPLAPALGKRAETLPLLERFDRLRNTVAHSRPVLTFEADLLSGIAGEIRNRVTIYMTEQDPSGDHYPRIESVTDSFGRVLTSDQGVVGGLSADSKDTIRVVVGDVVTFDCAGSDAQERDLSWEAEGSRTFDTGQGARTSLRWTVTESDVRQWTTIQVTMRSSGRFHRHGQHDDRVTFFFEVVPPGR